MLHILPGKSAREDEDEPHGKKHVYQLVLGLF